MIKIIFCKITLFFAALISDERDNYGRTLFRGWES